MPMLSLLLLNLLFVLACLFLLPEHPWLFGLSALLLLILAISRYQKANRTQRRLLESITQGLRRLQDGDFSVSLAQPKEAKNSRDSEIIELFNQVTDDLRKEKQTLYQRELLLDRVVNASDVLTLLINHRQTLVFANSAAVRYFNKSSLLGEYWPQLIAEQAPELAPHLEKNNAIIQLTNSNSPDGEHSWHLSRNLVKLHGANHQLIMFKPLTKELHQQELKTWKKVIRVINHELNNSIAPISSMCHSGKMLAEQLHQPQLDRVFNTISNRILKLSEFIQNYSQLARLSQPKRHPFDIIDAFNQLAPLYNFQLTHNLTDRQLNADKSQIDQLLINLLKNAQEVNGPEPTQVTLKQTPEQLQILIKDSGPGMPADVMTKAFLPYFSTKASGSGIGLSICREVVDAHFGQIELNNHHQGGLQVSIQLPR